MVDDAPHSQPHSPNQLNEDQRKAHYRLINDLPYFSKRCIKIKTKDGTIIPFVFNKAQNYIHEACEDQLRRIGMVRKVIVKGRQQGCSEYVSVRFFKKAVMLKAKTVYILSHLATSTKTLFGKVTRYNRHMPPQMMPGVVTDNTNEIKWDNESEYSLGTAGTAGAGRSNTVQYLHLSEPAHYEGDESVRSGVLQTVADVPGTEIIYETTCNGMNWFYQFCMKILAGESIYEIIFIPWFWTDEYASTVRPGFNRTIEENQLVTDFGLTNEQLQWRRDKISELGERLFRQEYPCTLMEAFQSSGKTFYDTDLVSKAMRCNVKGEAFSPLVLGVDPARTGDRTVLCLRRGREVIELFKYDKMETMQLAGIIANIIDSRKVDKCFVDFGLGYGTVDRLRELGYSRIVQGVHFNERPLGPQYSNKRTEMAFLFRDWLSDGDVNLPDDNDMAIDINAMPDFKTSSNGKLSFPDKEQIRKDYGRSPDILDAIILTFAYPVRGKEVKEMENQRIADRTRKAESSTFSRIRDRFKKSKSGSRNI